ncbi:hypothetical protein K435DRAFT_801676 [Dendrothele bispora CBS 962.96]|uniref:Sensor domain-containing protein n=1 Tax=Dendrothele bispora (strain CBS 962.96) TaxID=1314807 RepID=A0A4V4HEG5_DENBC|nr:hypothetical protein K435DRAFT_801676 [Dendrothele bispora CBS 962.96]
MSPTNTPPPPPPPIDSATDPSTLALAQVIEPPTEVLNDPPPPYPSPGRTRRVRRARRASANVGRIQTSGHSAQESSSTNGQLGSPDSHSSDYDPIPEPHSHPLSLNDAEDHDRVVVVDPSAAAATETTPLLLSNNHAGSNTRSAPRTTRPRSGSISHGSIFSHISQSPSLAQTVRTLFQTEYDEDYDEEFGHDVSGGMRRFSTHGSDCLEPESATNGAAGTGAGADAHVVGNDAAATTRSRGWLSKRSWKRYFRPLARKPYYTSLFHLLVLNFPYALAAWVYLFVFTLTGTALLMALPLGAVLCFFNLIGARIFARGELYLQTKFHSPLPYPPPYPPRPIFTRSRLRQPDDIEPGHPSSSPDPIIEPEPSFYKNTYALFTDPTSYQALFYFLVIKPAITVIFSFLLLVLVIPAMVLVVTAPMALRAVRRLGVWQAGVAVEGLWVAVR